MMERTEMIMSRMEELGLSFMAAGLESFLSSQVNQDAPLAEAISELVDLELIPRKERMARTRLKVSGIPSGKSLEEFDLAWLKGGLTQKKFAELSSLSFIERRENVILLGPSGLGKTHLMTALGQKACLNGFTAYYITCLDLLERLHRSRDQGKLKQKLVWFGKPHVLLVDEVGYENLSPEQATLFFQLINTRYEHGSIILTSNKPFGKWGEIMADDAVATATLDRLLHHSHVITLNGNSYRMKDRMKIGVVDF
ncbi:IS21-like element helper ATPase IstB [candidate division KSB1 bacterium]|nr:IS21-like element helper ATPase IstB [candidate division KSB1 bacterium]